MAEVPAGGVPFAEVPGQLALFGPPANASERLSPDRRRTRRQHADVERGVHPFTGGRTRPDLGTCGGCVHRISVGGHAKAYPKCDAYGRPGMTHGARTDVRAHWPACDRWEAS